MRKNSIPFCMIPFIANMMKSTEDKQEGKSKSILEWLQNNIQGVALYNRYSGESSSDFFKLLFSDVDSQLTDVYTPILKDELEARLAVGGVATEFINSFPITWEIKSHHKVTYTDKGGVPETHTIDITYTLTESFAEFGTNFMEFNPNSETCNILRGSIVGFDDYGPGADLSERDSVSSLFDAISAIQEHMGEPSEDLWIKATITFSNGDIFTIDNLVGLRFE